MRLSFNKDQVKPGEKVQLTVSADPDSVVYIKGVDMSVLLLKDGNDITEDKVRFHCRVILKMFISLRYCPLLPLVDQSF